MTSALAKAMKEDDLLLAVTDALTLYKWRWTHHRRSDRALLMGHRGFPDVFAIRGDRALALELKSTVGSLTGDQHEWGRALERAGVTWWLVRPHNLDALLESLR